MLYDLACSDCSSSFSSAASLLQHFAEHASKGKKLISNTDQVLDNLEINMDSNITVKSELNYATTEQINCTKEALESEDKPKVTMDNNIIVKSEFKQILIESGPEQVFLFDNKEEENIDSGVEDVNPLQYCAVTLKTDNHSNLRKKYDCTFCLKSFGWSTDLKRHILIHTGERPFQCSLCDSTFTRKFLLQKHLAKLHHNKESVSNENEMQSQKDLYLKQKSRKQDKHCIKHNPKISSSI